MIKKMLGIFTAVVAALAVVGVAWAGGDGDAATSLQDDTSTSVTSPSTTTEATVDSSTPTTIDEESGTSITLVDTQSTSSTSVPTSSSTSLDDDQSSTSTSIAPSSSTTVADDQGRVSVPDGVSTHQIPGVGSVTISVTSGRLELVDVSASWPVAKQRVEADRVELELESGDDEAKFEARIRDGRVEVRVEVDD